MVGCARESRISNAEMSFTSIIARHLSTCGPNSRVAPPTISSFLEFYAARLEAKVLKRSIRCVTKSIDSDVHARSRKSLVPLKFIYTEALENATGVLGHRKCTAIAPLTSAA